MRHLGEWMHSGHTGMSKWIWGGGGQPPAGRSGVGHAALRVRRQSDSRVWRGRGWHQPAHADLYISYLVKHGQPRRREEAAPPCAFTTPIP